MDRPRKHTATALDLQCLIPILATWIYYMVRGQTVAQSNENSNTLAATKANNSNTANTKRPFSFNKAQSTQNIEKEVNRKPLKH
jgi:hypothetical protein